ncbi:hypothetical protein Poli38472_006424 [Pythium oligandrum]|uniref:Uncharacterized protein n=1 Tax=Pythium oligandrum TaxID=41045 RepID=A0A8K1FD22_PYTOL|nr:hypothetical protein Poli38472_006424 [Pythium oligandrum]|eukprot:TMW56414.1 hypothetical protein Poli38472_006424 [Pythium oligandrum]
MSALDDKPDDVLSFSFDALGQAQSEIGIHHNASQAILLHIVQRLSRLEKLVNSVQADVMKTRTEATKDTNEVRDEVTIVQEHVKQLSSRLQDVASVVDHFQSEIHNHKDHVETLSTTVQDEHKRITDVNEKVDNQRDEFDNRFNELHLRLDELPRTLAALQGSNNSVSFTFRTAERDKLSLQKHVQRIDDGRSPHSGPFTDLQPFTIPEDMKAKIESKIRQKEGSKTEQERRGAIELAEAYRRLQLAGYPRVTEIHMNVEHCREEVKRAFELIRTSNLQLYACCQAKIERSEVVSLQNELRSLRNRLRAIEGGLSYPVVGSPERQEPHAGSGQLSIWNLDKYFGASLQDGGLPVPQVTAAQVPELRVLFLEMTRNLHLLRKQWTAKQQPLNPLVRTHLESLVTLLNDAYSSTAEAPVDLGRVSQFVDKVARLLSSDLSQHLLQMMTGINSSQVSQSSVRSDVTSALEGYSKAFNDATHAVASSVTRVKTFSNHTTAKKIQEHQQQLEQMQTELAQVQENLRELEAAARSGKGSPGGGLRSEALESTSLGSSGDTAISSENPPALRHVVDQIHALRDQLLLMRRQFVREEAFSDLVYQFEQWRKERERAPISGIVGQRMSGASSVSNNSHIAGGVQTLRRSNSGTTDLDAYIALTGGGDQTERPKSQTKLDPVQVRGGGSAARNKHKIMTATSIPSPARNGVLGKMQARAQALRPKSGVQQAGG